MKNYFISKIGLQTKYVIPEIYIIKNKAKQHIYTYKINQSPNITVSKVTNKFNPEVSKVNPNIELEAFILGPKDVFFKVTEGYYCVSNGTLKLKVKKKYGE